MEVDTYKLMEERERIRERKSVRESESVSGVRDSPRATENVEGEVLARPRKSVRKGGFEVESKSFEVEVEEKRGRLQATIVERKRGISSWIRLGPASLGLFLDCLVLCIEDVRTAKWLDVVDLENKRFSIFIPKGRGAKGGWVSMVETLRRLGCANRGMTSQKKKEPRLKPSMAKTFTEVIKMLRGKIEQQSGWRSQRRSCARNLNKLDHYVVGIWNPSAAKGDGLRKAEQAIKLGSISVRGIFLRLEKWRPETGCLREGENKSEAWVRVVGLPVSLWERDILRRIGEECGGFLAVDSQTKKMEELQWARPVISGDGRKEREVCRNGRGGWGEACTRAGERVMEAKDGSRLEALLLHADGTRGQSSGSGQVTTPIRSFDGPLGGPQGSGGLTLLGLAEPLGALRNQSPLGSFPSRTPYALMAAYFWVVVLEDL
ncbi:hypothetical protein CK203_103733 [Vitis vinifera]|uniref:Uncharacterized protein n=1 Tax=Vitis vinifera TaxID=29760 RepID=A0A438D4E1_VITVI|nr:hypothetical protein CK203_103733 [Vitis vinifera]